MAGQAWERAAEVGESPWLELDVRLIELLRADLKAAGWTVGRMGQMLSEAAAAALARDQLVPAYLECSSDPSPAATLTLLFVLAGEVEGSRLSRAIPSLGVENALRLGLIEDISPWSDRLTPAYRARVDLRPHDGALGGVDHHWWVASDLGQAQTGRPPREDHVLGIAAASLNLLRLTMRDPVDSALDLGCGSGILALYLSTHARRVVATDLSSRACHFTRFNALLNEVDLDVREGSLFEPVEGERFDLITSNPPFVITPEAVRARANLEYRDGGMSRDHLVAAVVKEGAEHLAPGGTLQLLANWEVTEPEDWAARPSRWIEDAAAPLVDRGVKVAAWVAQRDLVDAAQYAEWWMADAWGSHVQPRKWNQEYEDWLADFAAEGVRYVGLGSIAFQLQAEGEPGLQLSCDDLGEAEAPDGRSVRTALENLELPADWEQRPLTCASDVREVRYFIPGSEKPSLLQLSQGRAGGSVRTVSPAVAALVGVSDGQLRPSQVIPAIAMLLEVDPETVREELRAALPELLRSGVVAHN